MPLFRKILRKAEKLPFINNRLANHFVYENASREIKRAEIKKCFENRPQESTVNEEIIGRIIRAYQLAIKEKIENPEIYTVSNEWVGLYKQYMGDIMNTLEKGDKGSASNKYANFMREKFSTGLHGLAIDMHDNFFAKPVPGGLHTKMYLNDSNYRFDLWKSSKGLHHSADALFMPDYGNAYGYYKESTFIRTGAEYLHYYASSIRNLLKADKNKKNVIVEIGGGYGGLAWFLNNNNNNQTYIDLDLPENMALTAYYLLCCFPEKKILLYGEDTIENVEKYDIVILPNFCLDRLPDNCADLVFNSYSLAEMSASTIRYYVEHIKSVSRQYIFHVNHTSKSSSINADNFGFDADSRFSLIYRAKAMWNMYRNFRCDEYEYLYKKCDTP